MSKKMKGLVLGRKGSSAIFQWGLYLLPALLFYIIFMAWPLIDSMRLSFYTGSSGASREFVGFENFRNLFMNPQYSERYWGAFGHTWYFFLIHMLVQNCLGILFAVILTGKNMKNQALYQAIIFIPVTLAILVTGYLWKLILNPVWSGPFLEKIGLEFLVRPWLGDRATALTAVSLVSCWQWIGIPTMMFVAALKNISEDLFEAADIDGANTWQVFWKIKLPMVKPVVGMIAILTFVNNFNAFDVVFSMETANGAPNYVTDLIGTLFYRVGIAGQHPVGIPDPGLGTAIAAVTFLVLCIGVIPTLYATQGKE
jgi:raffinose/stachyose/melibiose transport system permease protein